MITTKAARRVRSSFSGGESLTKFGTRRLGCPAQWRHEGGGGSVSCASLTDRPIVILSYVFVHAGTTLKHSCRLRSRGSTGVVLGCFAVFFAARCQYWGRCL